MRVGAFELDEPVPELKEPHVLAMLKPWIDVGSVGTLVLSWLESHYAARDMGKLARPGDFFDFTRYRPTISMIDGQRQTSVPNTTVSYSKQETGNDFIFLHLLEPHNHSEDYVDAMLQLLEKFDVKRYCLLGSMYDYMPHSRPLIVTGGTVSNKTGEGNEQPAVRRSNYQGPTTITSLISQRASPAGIETMSYIVHLPQYTQLDEDYMGAIRMLEELGSLYDLPKDDSYVTKAERQQEQINSALEKNPQLKTIVEQLENHYDSRAETRKEDETPRLSPEVETFLAEMDRRFRED
jgi:hypothetical protein